MTELRTRRRSGRVSRILIIVVYIWLSRRGISGVVIIRIWKRCDIGWIDVEEGE